MSEQRTGVLSNSLLWFGAAISIAEIMTGVLLAPLGFQKAGFAIVLGHVIGGILLYFAGIIGAQTGKSAMESCRIAFGNKGSYLFSALNVIQLIGWTAVMIIGGAKALTGLDLFHLSTGGWAVLIGAMIGLWILLGVTRLGKVSLLAVGSLFILTILLSFQVFSGHFTPVSGEMSFGLAVELSVAMPLSWLPLIADYTRLGKKGRAVTLGSVLAYSTASTWMYFIGLGMALFTAGSDLTQILLSAGLGVAALLIVILSTVTTTFLDAYSAGVSVNNLVSGFNSKHTALAITLVGTLIAIFTPIEAYQNFLYFIGSVFAPMVSVLLTHYFILKGHETTKDFNWSNLIGWGIGFLLYRQFMTLDTPIGSTIPVMVVVSVLTILMHYLFQQKKEKIYVENSIK